MKIEGPEKGIVPVQIIFCLKEKNQKKINSHRLIVWRGYVICEADSNGAGGSSTRLVQFSNLMSAFYSMWGQCPDRHLYTIFGRLLISIPMSAGRVGRLLRSKGDLVSIYWILWVRCKSGKLVHRWFIRPCSRSPEFRVQDVKHSG